MAITGERAENSIILEGVDKIVETDELICGNLFKGTYTMASYADDVMIRKGKEIRKNSYDLLVNFNHDSAISMLNFYYDKDKVGCTVIPKVDSSFLEWVKVKGNLLFTHESKMTALFRTMITELCDLIETLGKSSIALDALPIEDLYINETRAAPKLLVLLTQVKWSTDPKGSGRRGRALVKSFIEWCCKECHVELDSLGRYFSDFIVSEKFTVANLKKYPYDWDYELKGEYLMCLISAGNNVRKAITRSKVTWPVELPDLLLAIIEHEKKLKYEYDTKDPYDYLRLLRNVYKHFDRLTDSIKAALRNQEGLLKQIEAWTPNIWARLYDFTGDIFVWHARDRGKHCHIENLQPSPSSFNIANTEEIAFL